MAGDTGHDLLYRSGDGKSTHRVNTLIWQRATAAPYRPRAKYMATRPKDLAVTNAKDQQVAVADNPEAYLKAVTPATRAVEGLVEATFDVLQARRLPEHDSQAMKELEAEQRLALHDRMRTPTTDAFASISQYIAAGCDHVRAMCTLYRSEPPIVFGDRVLLRAAIEAFSRSAWISEDVDATERARRMANERLASMDDQLAMLKQTVTDPTDDLSPEVVAAFKELRLQLAGSFEAAGIGAVGRKDGRVFVKPRRPSPTSVIKWFGDHVASGGPTESPGRLLQSLYAGFTHSSLWALMSAIEVSAALPDLELVGGGTAVAPLVSRSETAVRSLGVAGAFLATAVDQYCTLMGWKVEGWHRVRDLAEQEFDRYDL